MKHNVAGPIADLAGAADELLPPRAARALFWRPRLLQNAAWTIHVPFAFWLVETCRPAPHRRARARQGRVVLRLLPGGRQARDRGPLHRDRPLGGRPLHPAGSGRRRDAAAAQRAALPGVLRPRQRRPDRGRGAVSRRDGRPAARRRRADPAGDRQPAARLAAQAVAPRGGGAARHAHPLRDARGRGLPRADPRAAPQLRDRGRRGADAGADRGRTARAAGAAGGARARLARGRRGAADLPPARPRPRIRGGAAAATAPGSRRCAAISTAPRPSRRRCAPSSPPTAPR